MELYIVFDLRGFHHEQNRFTSSREDGISDEIHQKKKGGDEKKEKGVIQKRRVTSLHRKLQWYERGGNAWHANVAKG